MQFRLPTTSPCSDVSVKQLSLTGQDKTMVSKVMVYSLHGYNKVADKIIVYTADKNLDEEKNKSVLGVICLTGVYFLFVCFVALHPKSTDMVMAGLSVHLTTLFSWASLSKRLTSTSCTYFAAVTSAVRHAFVVRHIPDCAMRPRKQV